MRHYAHHNYPGGSIEKLQTHSQTANNIRSMFDADVAAVKRQTGKEYVLGETNSGSCPPYVTLLPCHHLTKKKTTTVSGGGAANVSPTFGAALWTMDYALRAASSNISRIYFHHGTVGNCQYCFWGRYSMGAPYYGATAAVALMAGARYLAALDGAGTTKYAAYASFDGDGRPLRVLLYNSEYYTGGTRPGQAFTLTGLAGTGAGVVKAKRLTAASSLARADKGDAMSFGGQHWTDGTCMVGGTETFETVKVENGQATFDIKAAEALVVYL